MEKLFGAAAEIKKFYDEEYYGKNAKHSALPWHCKKIGLKLGDVAGKKVLDVACGTGEWLAFFKQRGAKISGIDISEVAVDICKKRFSTDRFFCAPAENLPFNEDEFDLITCMGSLEHFLDKPTALSEMRRVAKKNARLVILVPNAGFLTRRLGLYRGTEQVVAKEDVYSLDAWNQLFTDAGLRVVNRWSDLHPISMGWIARGNVFLWPIRALQAMALAVWPLSWQYQVYHCCVITK